MVMDAQVSLLSFGLSSLPYLKELHTWKEVSALAFSMR